jgi:hypothetical protein
MLDTSSIRCKFFVAVSALVSRMLGLLMLFQGFFGAKLSVTSAAMEGMLRSLMLVSSVRSPERTVAVSAFMIVLRLIVHTESILVDKRTITNIAFRHGGSSRLGGWTIDTVEVPHTTTRPD